MQVSDTHLSRAPLTSSWPCSLRSSHLHFEVQPSSSDLKAKEPKYSREAQMVETVHNPFVSSCHKATLSS